MVKGIKLIIVVVVPHLFQLLALFKLLQRAQRRNFLIGTGIDNNR
jgi:hypothetical protein